MKLQFPRSAKNWTSLMGATIALISLFMIVFLFAVTTLFGAGGSYIGLVIYILLPGVMIIGLLLIPIGMIKARKIREQDAIWPKIDLNQKPQRNAFMIFSVGTTLLLFISAIGSYQAFHYTESVEFCGTTCHSVMEPEHTAYQHSSHARVTCVQCHVGEGADWYVRSKLSGLYQVYSVIFSKFERPIPTPIHNLRPSRDICEKCHWPQKFYAHTLQQEYHYLPDDENTRWQIQMTMKTGAPHQAQGLEEGIHWHINPDIEVSYKATDEARKNIPWVKLKNLETGEEKIFMDEDDDVDQETLAGLETRTMQCIDCHTRPSHEYRPPNKFINEAITAGNIPQSLPEIKLKALEVCDEEYPTMEAAMKAIDSVLTDYYTENYDEFLAENPNHLKQAIAGLQEAYKHNIFPEMKVRWDAYPDHIGHLNNDGCFRCHNSTHLSESGESISRDCNLCHIITAQGTDDDLQLTRVGESLEFRHPEDIDEAWKESLCTDCHTGVNP